MQARLYLNLGVTKEYMDDIQESITFMEQSMTICRKYDFYELLHQCYITIALRYQNQKLGTDTTNALRFLNLALEKAECLENSHKKVCETLILKSDILIKMGDYQSAKQVLWKGYKLKTPNAYDRKKIEKTLKVCKYNNK